VSLANALLSGIFPLFERSLGPHVVLMHQPELKGSKYGCLVAGSGGAAGSLLTNTTCCGRALCSRHFCARKCLVACSSLSKQTCSSLEVAKQGVSAKCRTPQACHNLAGHLNAKNNGVLAVQGSCVAAAGHCVASASGQSGSGSVGWCVWGIS
jgi:hypothetical protein